MKHYVGLDVSKEETSICVIDELGRRCFEGKASSMPTAIFEFLSGLGVEFERVVLETGSMSLWLHRELCGRGFPMVCVDARQAHSVLKLQHHKTDRGDLRLLAELARTGFYREVRVKDEVSHADRAALRARDQLVRQRRDVENTVRGLLRSFGLVLPKGVGRFPARVDEVLRDRPDLAEPIEALMSARLGICVALKRLDREVERRVRNDPVCRLLMTAPGVGPITALTFAATIDDPRRFPRSQSVGVYAGLTARRNQSGDMDYTGRISKMGDALLRKSLYGAATLVLTRIRRRCALKVWGLRLKRRIGHKKACVAVARKLAVLLHRMWMDGIAFRWSDPEPALTA